MWDPVWDDDDAAFALAWHEYQRTLCLGCGRPLDECMAGGWDQAYVGKVEICHACREAELTRKAYLEGKGPPAGMHVRLADREGFEPPPPREGPQQ